MWKKVFRRQAYYFASVAFIVLGLVYFIVTINQPCIGLNIKNVNGQWFVTYSDPDDEGYQAGVRVGDIVLKINDDVPGNYRFFKKWRVAEGASSIEVRRSDQPTDNIIELPVRTNGLKNLKEVPLHILGFVFWLLGFMTWYKRPFLPQARAIFWLNWIIGLVIVFTPASGCCLLFGKELCYISMSLIPVFIINLVSVFPKDNRNRANRLSCHLFAIIAIVLITFTILQSSGLINNASSLLEKIILSTDIIALLLALWNFGSLIMQPKDNPEKNQAGILFLGMMIGFFPFVILTAVPLILGFQPIRYFDFISLFLSVIPVSLYYVIVNRYLPDSRRLFETVISFFIVGVITSFGVSYVLYLLKVVKTFNLEVYLASLSLTMLFMVCISFMRVVISKLLEKLAFIKGKQGFKERVLRLNESLTSVIEEDRILEEVVKSLSLEGAFIIVENAQGGYLKKAVGRFLEKPVQQAELEEFFQADQRINLEVKILPKNFPAEIYIP
ncbi:MAG: histidine kinase, partial [Desulfosporosinus sp.]